MSQIRPEQMSHSKFLRRGRDTRVLQYVLLVVAVLAAAVGTWAVVTLAAAPQDFS